ncbi:MAG: DUF2721 domain-containing protein [Gammaproteobacteria bacterium]
MDILHPIQSAVAPVFLLSGVGVTLGVLTGRLARIIDRARQLEEQADAAGTYSESILESLQLLARRAKYTNAAIALCTVSALFVSLVVMALFASAFLGASLSGIIAILFVAAMICLTVAFGAFLIECRLATQILRFGAHRHHGSAPRAPIR